ncbi:alpha/beta hydrolase [Rhodococcus sp. NPDC056960]|uniref:alpha/beta hydrolase n=1 Tax=Rhodococcus sp. NPDC056960 TaxID=3345982 RepID=UPI003632F602
MTYSQWQDVLDADALAVAKQLDELLPGPLHTLGLDGVRKFAAPTPPPRTTRVASVEDRTIAGVADGGNVSVPVRIYQPDRTTRAGALLYIHGGGFTVGSLDGVDELCRVIADEACCVVVSVDYRLAPEHPFPAAIIDVRAAYDWLRANSAELGVAPSQLAVGGDSAGGGLAASLCLDLRRRGIAQPVMQLLVYPAVDDQFTRPSWTEFKNAPLLDAGTAQWFWKQYVGDSPADLDELAVPMKAGSLAGLARAHIATAEVDPLRDDGEAYAAGLHEAGVAVRLQRYTGVFHGFFPEVQTYAKSRRAVLDACESLQLAFRLGSSAAIGQTSSRPRRDAIPGDLAFDGHTA